MHFYEFIEGLARAAEKLSLKPLTEFNKEPPILTIDERRILPLEIKIEGLILAFYYKLSEKIKK